MHEIQLFLHLLRPIRRFDMNTTADFNKCLHNELAELFPLQKAICCGIWTQRLEGSHHTKTSRLVWSSGHWPMSMWEQEDQSRTGKLCLTEVTFAETWEKLGPCFAPTREASPVIAVETLVYTGARHSGCNWIWKALHNFDLNVHRNMALKGLPKQVGFLGKEISLLCSFLNK